MTTTTPPQRCFPSLPVDEAHTTGTGRRLRICIVSNELVGPSKNGGIGTAYTVMAESLAQAGHEVTCLYTLGEECASHDISHWEKEYRKRNVRLVPLPRPAPGLIANQFATYSYEVYLWLKQNDRFDFIHFPECQALGYYAQLAKRQGLAFSGATICVGIHSMHQWIKEANREYIASQFDLQLDHMERESVALADVLWSPSQYLINWISQRGWQLPSRCYVQPYIMPHAARVRIVDTDAAAEPIAELVFFGRLETRKGLALFCDALDRLPAAIAAGVKQVTFLGREAMVDGVNAGAFISGRAKAWTWPVRVISDMNQPEAVAYVRGPGRLAIMPSLMENSPNTVYECLGSGIAFLASTAGGIPELIAPGEVERVCFARRPDVLAGKLASVLGKPFRPASLAFDATENERTWIRWHESFQRPAAVVSETTHWPKVSLCVTTFNRPQLLRQALDSIEKIVYPDLEVVLVDDGSTDPDAITLLEQLGPIFAQRGWQIVRQPNRYLGAARNTAARQASGDYLLFMDDDNVAEPHQVETMMRAMQASGADIVTCGLNHFAGWDEPDRKVVPQRRWLPLGGAVAAGAFSNVFGDANALVRKACFEGVGGFTEDYGVTHEDWEFHARAVLKGYALQVCPEFLAWYRVNDDSMIRTLPPYPNQMRSLRPYLDAVPPMLRSLVAYAHGSTLKNGEQGNSTLWLAYAELTVKWRSKLEAGLELAAMGRNKEAIRLMLAGLTAVEGCKVPRVLLEALLGISEHLVKLDPSRARRLLGIAVEVADRTRRPHDKKKALTMIAKLSPQAKEGKVMATPSLAAVA